MITLFLQENTDSPVELVTKIVDIAINAVQNSLLKDSSLLPRFIPIFNLISILMHSVSLLRPEMLD